MREVRERRLLPAGARLKDHGHRMPRKLRRDAMGLPERVASCMLKIATPLNKAATSTCAGCDSVGCSPASYKWRRRRRVNPWNWRVNHRRVKRMSGTNLFILGVERQELHVIRQRLGHGRERLRGGGNSDTDEGQKWIRALHVVCFSALQNVILGAQSDEEARR